MIHAYVVAVLLWLPWAVGASGNPGSVIVRGTVQAAQGSTAIGNATVVAYSETDVQQTQSDATGHFMFINLLPGIYKIYADKSGYLDCVPDPTRVELSAGQEYDAEIILNKACR